MKQHWEQLLMINCQYFKRRRNKPNNSKILTTNTFYWLEIIYLSLLKVFSFKQTFTFFQNFWKSVRKSNSKGHIWKIKVTLFRHPTGINGNSSRSNLQSFLWQFSSYIKYIQFFIPSHSKYIFHKNNNL